MTINNSSAFSYSYTHPNLAGYTIVCQNWVASAANKGQVIINSDSAFTGYTYSLGSAESYGYIIGATFATINAIVPVTLVDFSASKIQNDVVVNWKTASEVNLDRFEVQRSLDGANFSATGSIYASKAGLYSFNDRNAAKDFASSKMLHYRLKMVDKDGSFKYSPIANVKLDKSLRNLLSVYPSPFKDEVNVRVNTENAGLAKISITDIAGRVVAMKSVFLPQGSNLVNMEHLSGLNKGTYVLTVDINATKEHVKLVK